MRSFISVEIPGDIKKDIGNYIAEISDAFEDVKWVNPENLHLTIKFLGNIRKSDVPSLRDCVAGAAKEFDPFSLTMSHLGFFPDSKHPRVVWIGVDGGLDSLLDVFQYMENCLEEIGFDREARTFSPHLTIGRARRNSTIEVPAGVREFEPVTFEVEKLALMKSTLTPQGPIYESMYESMLGSE